MCNGICSRLYKAKRIRVGASMYIGNKRCSHCERFISMDGVFKKETSWNCKCCGSPVRHTPYAGRKSIVQRISDKSTMHLYVGNNL